MVKKSFKTEFSGRRRTVTRKSGFNVNHKFNGTRLKFDKGYGLELKKNQTLTISFEIENNHNNWICYGLYFNSSKPIEVEVKNNDFSKKTLNYYGPNCWSKIGSIWQSDQSHLIEVIFKTESNNTIYFYDYDLLLL